MATQRPWIYLQNPFINATDGSFSLGSRISTYHLNALKTSKGNPFFDALIAAYEPLDDAYHQQYAAWRELGGSQTGQTLSFNNLLLLLRSTKIRAWDVAIQGVYDKKTTAYQGLFPDGRIPFQTGRQEGILNAVKALANATAKDAALQGVGADIKQFYTQLHDAEAVQKSAITNTKNNSDALERARIAMCIGQYANLGALIQHFAATPESINQHFDMLVMHTGSQVLFTGSVKAGAYKNIFIHTFAGGEELQLTNDGTVPLTFYLTHQKEAAADSAGVTVPAGGATTAAVTMLGDADARFLNVYNADGATKGAWTVEFV